MIDFWAIIGACLPYIFLVGGLLGIFAYEDWKRTHKKQHVKTLAPNEHDLTRFSHWTVYCSKCDKEFQDPNGERSLPFPNEALLPKLSDNLQCNGVH